MKLIGFDLGKAKLTIKNMDAEVMVSVRISTSDIGEDRWRSRSERKRTRASISFSEIDNMK